MSYYKVVYDKLFPYAPYLNERIGIEMLVEAGQSPAEALQEAKKIVEDFYHASNPHPVSAVSIVADNVPVPEVQLEKPKQTTLEEDIMSSPSLNVLQSYRIIVKNKPDLQAIYDTKLKEFQP